MADEIPVYQQIVYDMPLWGRSQELATPQFTVDNGGQVWASTLHPPTETWRGADSPAANFFRHGMLGPYAGYTAPPIGPLPSAAPAEAAPREVMGPSRPNFQPYGTGLGGVDSSPIQVTPRMQGYASYTESPPLRMDNSPLSQSEWAELDQLLGRTQRREELRQESRQQPAAAYSRDPNLPSYFGTSGGPLVLQPGGGLDTSEGLRVATADYERPMDLSELQQLYVEPFEYIDHPDARILHHMGDGAVYGFSDADGYHGLQHSPSWWSGDLVPIYNDADFNAVSRRRY